MRYFVRKIVIAVFVSVAVFACREYVYSGSLRVAFFFCLFMTIDYFHGRNWREESK